jgi:hypothetical protein
MKKKATYNPAFSNWLPDVKACHDFFFLKAFSTKTNISEDGGLATEIIRKLKLYDLTKTTK